MLAGMVIEGAESKEVGRSAPVCSVEARWAFPSLARVIRTPAEASQ